MRSRSLFTLSRTNTPRRPLPSSGTRSSPWRTNAMNRPSLLRLPGSTPSCPLPRGTGWSGCRRIKSSTASMATAARNTSETPFRSSAPGNTEPLWKRIKLLSGLKDTAVGPDSGSVPEGWARSQGVTSSWVQSLWSGPAERSSNRPEPRAWIWRGVPQRSTTRAWESRAG